MKKLLLITIICATTLKSECQKIIIRDHLDDMNIAATYQGFDKGGNTSIAFDSDDSYKWSGKSPFKKDGFGYFTVDGSEVAYIKRDRDLGQTFTFISGREGRLKSITVKLGFGNNVIRPGMYGQNLSLQIFEVTGEPSINDNGSSKGIKAFHGFPHNRYADQIPGDRDDFVTGEKYVEIALIRNFIFPLKSEFGFTPDNEISPDDKVLKGKLLTFILPEKSNILLEPGKHYAFLIMIDKKGDDHGFTLANHYYGAYSGGHGIRRDGNGVFPPAEANPAKDFKDPENRQAYISAHFPIDFKKRKSIPPSTNGYPDVDTWRDLWFAIEID